MSSPNFSSSSLLSDVAIANANATPTGSPTAAAASPPNNHNKPNNVNNIATPKGKRKTANNSNNSSKWKNHALNRPTNSIVLKNLDYNMTKETLGQVVERVMQRHNAHYTNITLVDDKATRTFRGMAFVSFGSVHEASLALEEMGKVVINGRKVVVEFRRSNSNNSSTNANNMAVTNHANLNINGGEMDKRAQFFANRDRDQQQQRQQVNSNANAKAKRKDKDKEKPSPDVEMLEAEFRQLLLQYSNGLIKSPVEQHNIKGMGEGEGNENRTGVSKDAKVENENDSDHSNKHSLSLEDTENSMDLDLDIDKEKENGPQKHKQVHDLVFDAALTAYERRIVHGICDELKLGHISRYDADGNRILRVTRDPKRAAEWAKEAQMEGEKKNLLYYRRGGGIVSPSTTSATSTVSRTSSTANGGSGEDSNNTNGNSISPTNLSGGILAPSYKIFTPKRQPTGPPGDAKTCIGFGSRVKFHSNKSKSPSSITTPANMSAMMAVNMPNAESNPNATATTNGTPTSDAKKKSTRKQSTLNPSLPSFSPMNAHSSNIHLNVNSKF